MSLTDEDKQWIARTATASEQRIITLIQSLSTRIDERFDAVDLRLEEIQNRTETHAASIQTGRRMEVRTEQWKERVNSLIGGQTQAITKILKRLDKLERARRTTLDPTSVEVPLLA